MFKWAQSSKKFAMAEKMLAVTSLTILLLVSHAWASKSYNQVLYCKHEV